MGFMQHHSGSGRRGCRAIPRCHRGRWLNRGDSGLGGPQREGEMHPYNPAWCRFCFAFGSCWVKLLLWLWFGTEFFFLWLV